MAVYMIENYVLRYDLDQERPWFIFHYKVSGSWRNVNWFPPKDNAVYLSDMLRNEKPVYYVESSSGKKWISTSSEQIGEEETQEPYNTESSNRISGLRKALSKRGAFHALFFYKFYFHYLIYDI